MRHLILHIGNHKTGTTAIQRWLASNEGLLASRGIQCLHRPGEPQVHSYLGACTPAAIFPEGFKLNRPETFREDLEALSAPTVVISSENFSFFVQEGPIAELAAILRPMFDKISIIAYLRRQDRQAVSHHAEGARPERRPEWELWGHALSALPNANDFQPLYLDYDRRLGLWEKAFGRAALKVRIYDRALLQGGDSVVDFCATAGIDMAGTVAPPISNTSMDRAKVRLGHILNALTPESTISDPLMRAVSSGRQMPTPARNVAQRFLKPYIPGNRALNARLNLAPTPRLFDHDFSTYPEEPEATFTDEEFNRVVRGLVGAYARAVAGSEVSNPHDLREAGVALAATQPERAMRLLNVARTMRPGAPMLRQMCAELDAWISGGKQGPCPDLARLNQGFGKTDPET